MTSRWRQDIALTGTGTLAAYGHLDDPDITCACDSCIASRRIAGKTAASQEITAQRHREAAARAQVTRELAGYGAYPYRSSAGRRCPARCGVPRCSHIKALDEGAAMAREQLAAEDWGSWHEPGCGCGCEKPWKPPETTGQVYDEADARGADPVAQWWEITRSIVLPDYGQRIARVPDQPPGTCGICRTGPLFKGNRCWYCWTREDLALAPVRRPAPDPGRSPLLAVILLLCIAGAGLCLGMLLAGLVA